MNEGNNEAGDGIDWYRKTIEMIFSTDVFIFIHRELLDLKKEDAQTIYKDGFTIAMKKVLDFMKERKHDENHLQKLFGFKEE